MTPEGRNRQFVEVASGLPRVFDLPHRPSDRSSYTSSHSRSRQVNDRFRGNAKTRSQRTSVHTQPEVDFAAIAVNHLEIGKQTGKPVCGHWPNRDALVPMTSTECPPDVRRFGAVASHPSQVYSVRRHGSRRCRGCPTNRAHPLKASRSQGVSESLPASTKKKMS